MVKKKFTSSKTIKGRTYQYFRKDGRYVRLPDDPNSEEYDREYWRLMRGDGPLSQRYTFEKLILSYKQSPRWESLAPRTRADYSRVLEYISDKLGSKDPTKMRRSTIIDAQMANRHRARFANYIPHMLSILFEHSIDLDWQRDNPAKGISKIKTGEGHKPWPTSAITAYRKHADGLALLIFELALGTGQRASDLTRMEWEHIEDSGIWVTQGKTKARLWLPFTARLAAVLDASQKTSPKFILADRFGKQLNYDQLQKKVMAVRRIANLTEYSLHGLRYSAAGELAEAGCTDQQIAAITGHKSLTMVQKYSKGASQKRLAKEAHNLRERNKNGS
ncbi:tyrosine-type recombinase/integrase [Phaeobacter italicus]|jgi:integrase|uniref:tyrosine-type recombinase/integrase n=1 Tax=Phaeobacter italicus TaxID=481446 RepID=UPI001ADD5F6D|nr:tyrosine-type recombinase/integrase [Phaeobacter italicus]MBO9441792.1 tyrosine-type recombinase/integrase [Phaeobacter italicus]MBY6043291.1 tyrosine-type recombinase/integrase [Phaeobacter italicus]